MKIVIIRKDSIKYIPPLLSAADILSDLGHQVQIISTGYSQSIKDNLLKHGISFVDLNYSQYSNRIGKVISYIRYRFAAKKVLSLAQFDYLWVEDAHTIAILGSIIMKYKFVLQISELYDDIPFLFRGIRKVIRGASAILMPEYNRACFYQAWFRLSKRPFVLPNKPYFVPNIEEIESTKYQLKHYLDLFAGKKIILYQGLIHPERTIDGFVSAASLLGSDWLFVILGEDQNGLVEKYRKLNPNLIHINFIPAPDYLLITSKARIGILSYSPFTLNTSYCAPNKIFEYGAFGIPMVGNNIPGLKILELNSAGIIVDENDVQSILEAYKKIDVNYDELSNNSKRLYNKTDNKEMIRSVMASL